MIKDLKVSPFLDGDERLILGVVAGLVIAKALRPPADRILHIGDLLPFLLNYFEALMLIILIRPCSYYLNIKIW